MELWDVYNKQRQKTGKVIKRGDKLLDGEYHIFVQVWLYNSKGEFLVQERSDNVKWSHMYCANGGNAISGEDGYMCAKREIKEELDLDIDTLSGGFFDTREYYEDNQSYFCDSYIYFLDKDIRDIKYQEYEIASLKYMTMDKIKDLMDKKIFFIYDLDYLDYIDSYVKEMIKENKKVKILS